MSYEDVMKRGEDFLSECPRNSKLWNYASHATCLFMICSSKLFMNTFYNVKLNGIEKLDKALQRSKLENRSLVTVMNHMSVVDDPFFYSALPIRYGMQIDNIRWGFGADNICFSNTFFSYFFNLGKILGTKRFGVGPFQDSLDAAIRILSPDDTLDLEFEPGIKESDKSILLQEIQNVRPNNLIVNTQEKLEKYSKQITKVNRPSVVLRDSPSWFHVFPEGFVLQLEPPHSNSMRYFKWGVARLIMESTKAPIVVPIFTTGFEKISPESTSEKGIYRFLPNNFGADIVITIGDPIDDELIEDYRLKWRKLCKAKADKQAKDLSEELRTGKKAQSLRSALAADLRLSVLGIRNSLNFLSEDPRFKDPRFWKEYTKTEGASAPDVKFIGKNWAIRRLQKHLPEYEEDKPCN